MLNSDHRNLLYTVLFTIISLIVICSVYGWRKDIFYRKNMNQQNALEEGYGYYDQEISLGCITQSSTCDQPGTETLMRKCSRTC